MTTTTMTSFTRYNPAASLQTCLRRFSAFLNTQRQAGRGIAARAKAWIQSRNPTRSRDGRLQLAESVGLGEKRVVTVVQIDGRRFLIGASSTGIQLLTELEAQPVFQKELQAARKRVQRKTAATATAKKKTRRA